MKTTIAALAAALALSGCGITEFFDQHPANVRPASADEDAGATPAAEAPASEAVPPLPQPMPNMPAQPPAQDASPEPPASAAAPTNAGAYCESLAKSRAADAAANGDDEDVQQAVHDGTYKNCIAWQSAHGGPN